MLAATIPYFNAMFTHDMVESKQNEISIQGIEAKYVNVFGHGPNPEKGIFFVFVATFWRQLEYT